MWQLYSIVSLLFGAAEETIDKATMVGSKTISHLNAAWIRNTISFGISVIVVIFASGALPVIVFSIPIILLGVLYGLSALTYTVMLKQVEITASSIMTSFIPLVFLPIDIFIFNADFLSRQILGVILLVVGGTVFFYRKSANKSSLSHRKILILVSIFLFDACVIGYESYLFKDYFVSLHLTEMNFLVNMWGAMFLFLTVLLVLVALYKRSIPSIHLHKKYIRGSFFSKITDYGNSFFFLKVLTLASVSQAASMKVFYPIVLIVIVAITQKRFGVDLEEYLDNKSVIQKVFGVVIICIGAFLAR